MAELQPDVGGTGGLLHPMVSQRMETRSIQERWPMPANSRKAIIGRLLAIIANPTAKPREITAAAKALMAADKLNLEQEERDNPTVQQHEHVHQLGTVERATAALDILKAEARRRGLLIDAKPV